MRANILGLPKGIPEPLIVGRGINDVAIVVLTLSARPDKAAEWTDNGLYQVAEELQHELVKVDNVGGAYLVGGSPNQIRVEPDPERLSLYGITLNQLIDKLTNANRSFLVGAFRDGNRSIPVVAGQTLQGVPDIGLLLLTSRDGRPVYVKDVADVVVGAAEAEHRAWTLTRQPNGELQRRPAVSLAIAKRKGANAVYVADDVIKALANVKGRIVPSDLEVTVTRNYGATATEKANELLFHLALATLSIVVLITLAIGWREGVVVLDHHPDHHSSDAVRLLADGLHHQPRQPVRADLLDRHPGRRRHCRGREHRPPLVDARRARPRRDRDRGGRGGRQPDRRGDADDHRRAAADDVRQRPDGPLHEPDTGQRLDRDAVLVLRRGDRDALAAAAHRAPKLRTAKSSAGHDAHDDRRDGPLLRRASRGRFSRAAGARKVVPDPRRRSRRSPSALCSRPKDVRVKLLPFDNKSEIQVVVDLPQGAGARGDGPRADGGRRPAQRPAGADVDPGLRRHGRAVQLQRSGAPLLSARRARRLGDLSVNLDAEGRAFAGEPCDRPRYPPAARRVAGAGAHLGQGGRGAARVRRSSPRCWPRSTGPMRRAGGRWRARCARPSRRSISSSTSTTVSATPSERLRFSVDQEALEFHGVEEQAVYDTIGALIGGAKVGYSQRGGGLKPIDISVALPRRALSLNERILSTPLPAGGTARQGANVELGDVVSLKQERASFPIFRHNGRFAEMVSAEVAGRFEAPIYGMLAVQDKLAHMDWGAAGPPQIRYHGQPANDAEPTLLWDGEWEVTYVTFRDMGAAFMVALLGIYLLVVAQFGSFRLPLVILIPVPLTLIGIMARPLAARARRSRRPR